MGKINLGRVLLGGLLAGVVLNLFEFVLHSIVLEEDWQAAFAALGKPEPGSGAIVIFVVTLFAVGILAIWLYAGLRPRFGPGPGTAICVGLLVWALAYLVPALGNIALGIFPTGLMLIPTAVGLVEVPLATLAGAWAYKED